ncbi:hypothetical protein UFOVP117_147 [uncultured Caudovirales phage]|uniref:HNHc domain containing protein n=1 Tax=uncultured Caudovirales phage TaxID=2100421 RepID=A0A6J5L696_9CAUD|nr:hypothetical protein UFOVP117_147 [uncultured Caudovirales phage]
METKICKTKRVNFTACGIEKTFDEFYKSSSLCKMCSKKLNGLRDKEYFRRKSKEYWEKNKEHYKQKSKEYREKNKDHLQKYRDDNKESIRDKYKEYYSKNVEKVANKNKKWRIDNIEKHREYNRKSAQKSRLENPEKHRWRYLLKETLKKIKTNKDDKTIVLLGYSPDELKKYLETLSTDWVNYEIDHKIPITWFKENTPASVVNDFRNLQLLTKSENNKKRNFWMSDVDDVYLNEIKKHIKEKYIK